MNIEHGACYAALTQYYGWRVGKECEEVCKANEVYSPFFTVRRSIPWNFFIFSFSENASVFFFFIFNGTI